MSDNPKRKYCGDTNTRSGNPCRALINVDATGCRHHSEEADAEWIQKKIDFMKVFTGAHGDLAAACRTVGVSKWTVYSWKRLDPDFAHEWYLKKVSSPQEIKASLSEMFFEGEDVPVIHQGQITDWYKKRDASLGKWLLSKVDPEYSDAVNVNHSVQRNLPVEADALQILQDPEKREAVMNVIAMMQPESVQLERAPDDDE